MYLYEQESLFYDGFFKGKIFIFFLIFSLHSYCDEFVPENTDETKFNGMLIHNIYIII